MPNVPGVLGFNHRTEVSAGAVLLSTIPAGPVAPVLPELSVHPKLPLPNVPSI
jgi:hypothetical protein